VCIRFEMPYFQLIIEPIYVSVMSSSLQQLPQRAAVPKPGLFSSPTTAVSLASARSGSASDLLMTDEQRERIRQRSEKNQQKKLLKKKENEERLLKARQEAVEKAYKSATRSKMSRARQAELASELIAKQDAMTVLASKQNEVKLTNRVLLNCI
jgi:hypothetical protein